MAPYEPPARVLHPWTLQKRWEAPGSIGVDASWPFSGRDSFARIVCIHLFRSVEQYEHAEAPWMVERRGYLAGGLAGAALPAGFKGEVPFGRVWGAAPTKTSHY
ncbi:MAG: hypothetical protein AAGF95_22415 [Chloroflexota bacterium]